MTDGQTDGQSLYKSFHFLRYKRSVEAKRKVGLKDRSLMSMPYVSNKKIVFKIGLLERNLKQNADFVCSFVRTDGQTKSITDRYLMSYLFNKKRIFKIRRLELVLEGGTNRRADISAMSIPTFNFFVILSN